MLVDGGPLSFGAHLKLRNGPSPRGGLGEGDHLRPQVVAVFLEAVEPCIGRQPCFHERAKRGYFFLDASHAGPVCAPHARERPMRVEVGVDARRLDAPGEPASPGFLEAREIFCLEQRLNGGTGRLQPVSRLLRRDGVRHRWKDNATFLLIVEQLARKEKEIKSSEHTSVTAAAGPLLTALIAAHRTAEQITAYPQLSSYASRLAALCEDMGSPLVWPVGEAAERLAGAAVLESEGEVRVRGWTDDITGERVLLITVAAVTPFALVQAAYHARSMGAVEVHACGAVVAGLDAEALGIYDSYAELTVFEPALMPA